MNDINNNKIDNNNNNDSNNDNQKVFFGFSKIDPNTKEEKVRQVFDKVANRYDLMNDVMSLGLHRLWKRKFMFYADLQPHYKVLDIAAGSGDLSILSAKTLTTGKVTVTDINPNMLSHAKTRIVDAGLIEKCQFSVEDAHDLSFPDNTFDSVICGFGLRNTTHIDVALSNMFRVLKPGGSVHILEFSKVPDGFMANVYDKYSYNIIPKLGKLFAGDSSSYQYLVESIRTHPSQEELLKIMQKTGFTDSKYKNFNLGVVAMHSGWKA